MHYLLHTHVSAHAQHKHTHARVLILCIVIMLTWFNAFSMLFEFIYSVFELVLLCFRLFYLYIELT